MPTELAEMGPNVIWERETLDVGLSCALDWEGNAAKGTDHSGSEGPPYCACNQPKLRSHSC